MNIYEFQAKRLLGEAGVRVPRGEVAKSPEQARENAEGLGCESWMVKAQIRAGGRGLGTLPDGMGGIRKATSLDEVETHAEAMLGRSLVTSQTETEGRSVKSVYVEEYVEVEREYGASVAVDERNDTIALLVTEHGGTQIETAVAAPGAMHRIDVDIDDGVADEAVDAELEKFDLSDSAKKHLRRTLMKLVGFFREKDAALVEVNPIGLLGDDWIAMDAKVAFDRNALYRHEDLLAIEQEGFAINEQRQASMDGFNYLAMDGNISSIAVGAGMSMATLDAIKFGGGKPANFLDLPPDSRVNRVVSALELVLSNPQTKCLVVNVFGGGIMRCDTVSDAITLVHQSQGIRIPMAVRLAGTNAELANRRLKETMPQVFLAPNLEAAATFAVQAARTDKKEVEVEDPPTLVSRVKSLLGGSTD